jgi:hypothetical protein
MPTLPGSLARLVTGTAMLLAPLAAQGQTWYTDRAAWEAAVHGIVNRTFEGFASAADPNFVAPGGTLTLDGATFVGGGPAAGSLRIIDNAFSPTFYDWGSGDVLTDFGPRFVGGSIHVDLPGATRAFGFDYMGFDQLSSILTSDMSLTLATSGGPLDRTITTALHPKRSFIGFVGPDAVQSLVYASTNAYFPQLDNFATALPGVAAVVTPEPASLALLGSGVLVLGAVARRRTRRV